MKPYFINSAQLLPGIVILIALLWLTSGASFLYLEKQTQVSTINYPEKNTNDSEPTSFPFKDITPDNSDEKTETFPKVFADEYLQSGTEQFFYSESPLKHSKFYCNVALVSFPCESFSPPPDSLS